MPQTQFVLNANRFNVGSRRLYSFEDIVELRVVSRLLGIGIALPAVRKAVRYLRLNFKQFARPLAQLSLIVDGRRVFVRATDPKRLIDVTAEGQLVISVAVAPILEDVRGQVAELRARRELTVRIGGRLGRTLARTRPAGAGCFSLRSRTLHRW